MKPWRLIVFTAIGVGVIVLLTVIAPSWGVSPKLVASVGFGLHLFLWGIKAYVQYERAADLHNLSKALGNYRCPLCNYFVGIETRQCPKCRRAITPKAD